MQDRMEGFFSIAR